MGTDTTLIRDVDRLKLLKLIPHLSPKNEISGQKLEKNELKVRPAKKNRGKAPTSHQIPPEEAPRFLSLMIEFLRKGLTDETSNHYR